MLKHSRDTTTKADMAVVVEINPEDGKHSRMAAAALQWEASDWYVARNAAWTEPLLGQITTSIPQ